MQMPIDDVSGTFFKIDADGSGEVDDEEFCDWLAGETQNTGLLSFLTRRSALMVAQAAAEAALQCADEAERAVARLEKRRELVAKFHQ